MSETVAIRAGLVALARLRKVNDDNKPSSSRDNRWAFFLLLVLNIPLYLGWTYIVRWPSAARYLYEAAVAATCFAAACK